MRSSTRSPWLRSLRAVLVVAAVCHALPAAQAQVCEGDVNLYRQSDVNAFDCSVVTGTVRISDSINGLITNLDSLYTLTSIGGSLFMVHLSTPTNIDGLSALAGVGGDVRLSNTSELPNLDGFSNLTHVGGSLDIIGNQVLTNVDGLASLEEVQGNLVIDRNPVLTECTVGLADLISGGGVGGSIILRWNEFGCNSVCEILDTCDDNCSGDIQLRTQGAVDAFECTEVEGGLLIGRNIGDSGPPSTVSDLSNLEDLVAIGGDLIIMLNGELVHIDGLSGLTSIGGDLVINKHPVLETIDGLTGLTTIPGSLKIIDNPALTDVEGLSNVTSVEGAEFRIENNRVLTSLAGLSGVTSIGWHLRITGNDALTNPLLTGITSIPGSLTMHRNRDLIDVGLPNLISVGLSVEIAPINNQYPNSSLPNLGGLGSLVSVGEHLYIVANPAMTNIDGLSNLTSVGGSLVILRNSALTDLSGLDGLISVGGSLTIHDNNVLPSVDGLTGLTNIGLYLIIRDNASLENVNGFASLTSVGQSLYVYSNPVLSECTVGLARLILEGGIGGHAYIYNNAPGCNSYWEALGGNVDAEDEAAPLVTGLAPPFPNPTTGAASITYTLAEPDEVTLTVYDALGRRVTVLAEGPQSAGKHEVSFGAGLPAGVYVVRFEAGDDAWTERITVVR